MASFDKYFGRYYDNKNYTCYHFAADVWNDLYNVNLLDHIYKLFDKGISREHIQLFTILDKPISPCFIVMQRGVTPPHIGIYYKGSVLHLTASGVEFQVLATAIRGFNTTRFFICKN